MSPLGKKVVAPPPVPAPEWWEHPTDPLREINIKGQTRTANPEYEKANPPKDPPPLPTVEAP